MRTFWVILIFEMRACLLYHSSAIKLIFFNLKWPWSYLDIVTLKASSETLISSLLYFSEISLTGKIKSQAHSFLLETEDIERDLGFAQKQLVLKGSSFMGHTDITKQLPNCWFQKHFRKQAPKAMLFLNNIHDLNSWESWWEVVYQVPSWHVHGIFIIAYSFPSC